MNEDRRQIDLLDEILGMIGLKISHAWFVYPNSDLEPRKDDKKKSRYVILMEKDGSSSDVVGCAKKNRNGYIYGFQDIHTLEDCLLSTIEKFVWHSPDGMKDVENPLLGCRSLEEAMVKQDLLDASLDRKKEMVVSDD